MKKLLFLFLTMFSLFLMGQKRPGEQARPVPAVIYGKVQSPKGLPMPYVSIGLYNINGKDTILKRGTVSNDKGEFEIKVKPNKPVSLKFSFLSYKVHWLLNIKASKALDIGTIVLYEDQSLLKEVIVEADKSQMELKLDKRVFNVGKDLTNKGANASDILETVPSVEVDMEGNVSLRGSENVRILIDGRPSGQLSGNLADALRLIPGHLIEQIEVITNPSSRYDADGEVGIINIIMKKEKQSGRSGSFNASTGMPHNHRIAANYNLKKKTINFFAGLNGGYIQNVGGGASYQRYSFPDTSYFYQRERIHSRAGINMGINAGLEWDITPLNRLSFTARTSRKDGDNITSIEYLDFSDLTSIVSREQRIERENDERINADLTISYFKSSKNNKTQWSSFIKRIQSTDLESGSIEETINDIVNSISQATNNNATDQAWVLQSDYVYSAHKDAKFEMGFKGSFKLLDNDFEVLEFDQYWSSMPDYDNHLIYKEDITAAYIMTSNKWKKLAYQIGCRGEFSSVSTHLLQTDQLNNRQYFYPFPSMHLSYEISKAVALQASYSRRIGRPRHWWLNPFFGLSDDRNYFTGNPNLDPSLTNAYEFSTLYTFDKGSVLISAYNRNTVNLMQRVIFVDSIGNTISQPHNIGQEQSFGLEFNGQYNISKTWITSTNMNFYRSIINGAYQDIVLSSDAFIYRLKLNSRWRLKRGYKFQSSFNYRSPSITPQGKNLAIYHWNGGFSKDIFNKNGTLTLTVRDILNSRKRRRITEGLYYYLESEFQWRARTISLNFSYRINQNLTKKRNNRTTSPKDYTGSDMDMDM